MENAKSSLRFIDYYVDEVQFYNNKLFEERSVELDFQISHSIEYTEDKNNTFFVTLNIVVFDNAEENNYPFTISVSITGIFQTNIENVDSIKNFAEINSIAILFPYLRSIVSTYTANANIQPLILPPINVVNMIMENDDND